MFGCETNFIPKKDSHRKKYYLDIEMLLIRFHVRKKKRKKNHRRAMKIENYYLEVTIRVS